MGQFRLRPPLFPCRVPPKHFCHPFICGKGTQFEALDKEQILKFDLEIHSIFSLSLSLSDSLGLVAWAKKKTCKPCNLNAIQADLGSISWSRPNQPCPHLFVAFFKMFHEHGNDHIDQHLKYRLFCVNYQDYSQIAPSERKLRRRVEQNIGWHSSSWKAKY